MLNLCFCEAAEPLACVCCGTDVSVCSTETKVKPGCQRVEVGEFHQPNLAYSAMLIMLTMVCPDLIVRMSVRRLQVRKAVGLGRLALDPLAIISVLLGRRKEVLSLRMHELQDKLPEEALVMRLEQVRRCRCKLEWLELLYHMP